MSDREALSDRRTSQTIGPQSTAGEIALRLADLALGTFGSVKATEQDRVELADHVVGAAVLWINQRWDIGLPSSEVQDPSVDVANVNAAYVIERDDNARLRAALEKIAYPPDFLQSRSVLSTWAREALNGGDR